MLFLFFFINFGDFFYPKLGSLLRLIFSPPPTPPKQVRREKIYHRRKTELMQPGKEHFLTLPRLSCSFSSFLSLTQSNVLLLELLEDEAVFITVPDTQKTTEIHPFYYEAQFNTGIELIFAPYPAVFEAVRVMEEREKKRGTKEPHIILLTSTGRCGSTLITQVLESQGREGEMLSISEPDWMIQLNKPCFNEEMRSRLLQAGVRLSLKREGLGDVGGKDENDAGPPPPSVLVLKPRSQFCQEVDLWMENFPDSDIIFLYRDCVKYINSWSSISHTNPNFRRIIKDLLFKFSWGAFLFPGMKELFERAMLLKNETWKERYEKEVKSEFYANMTMETLFGVFWLNSIEGYVNMRKKKEGQEKEGEQEEKNLVILPVNFDDFLKRKREATEEIVHFCGLSENLDLEKAEIALSKDSQQGSMISSKDKTEKRKKFNCQDLPTWPKQIALISKMAEIHPEIGSLEVVYSVPEEAREKIERNKANFEKKEQ